MKLEAVNRNVESSGMMEVSQAKVKSSRKIFDMFADQVYANKPVAIMRETVANGMDAHTAAGWPERPVEVTLPTELDPMCMIKDTGIGMSHSFVMGPFMEYTNGSTKDQSDDQIGGFGIGSKAPLSYVDQFTLRVVHEGVLSIYSLFKDTDGIPAIGRQSVSTTDEPNGVEISFPVQNDDVQSFRDAAQDALMYFSPLPIIHNGEIKPPKYTYLGKGWSMCEKAAPLGVIMGGVRYPVEPSNLDYQLQHDEKLSPLLQYGLDLHLPIGTCGIAMSREQLSYTPKTSASIRDALQGILDDVVTTFATFFDQCPTEWEAMHKLHNELGGERYYNRSARQQLMAANSRYMGRELKTEFRLADNDLVGCKSWRIEPKSRSRGLNCPTPKWNDGLTDLFAIVPGTIERIIVDDLEAVSKNKNVARIRYYVDQELDRKESVIVIRPPLGTSVDKVRDILRGCPDIVLTSTLPEPPKGVATSSGYVRPKVRMWTFDGTKPTWGNVTTNLTPAYGKKSITEIDFANQPATGIMVVMDSFNLPADLHNRMATDLFAWTDLVFVNTGDAAKLKGKFTNFEDAWSATIATKLAQFPELAQRIAVSNSNSLDPLFRKWKSVRERLPLDKLTAAQKARPFGKVAALYEKYVAPLTSDQRKFAPFVTATLPTGVDDEKMAEAVRKQQPKLNILLNALHLGDSGHIDILKDYL